MTTKQLQNRWLRTKRHLRSVCTSPRALRDADRALACGRSGRRADPARECLCRPAPPRCLSLHPVWRPRRLSLSDITWIPSASALSAQGAAVP